MLKYNFAYYEINKIKFLYINDYSWFNKIKTKNIFKLFFIIY